MSQSSHTDRAERPTRGDPTAQPTGKGAAAASVSVRDATDAPGGDPEWYREAVIYEVHVKAFFDSDNDGVGDFKGLTKKLDYLADLGITCLWVLPFYPSPLRDDGYDISDFRAINPAYGTMRDFHAFVREAHRRGLKVITELVVNHTSDQHPWFQRSRRAKRGSAWRNFYVWSDTDQAYQGTRIIFLDTESSNWTWDPVAQQYYWHRFYSHQPDLNYDNPRVVEEIIKVMRFWLDKGVDGLRLDAVPYLVEREGTSNENLPETHQILKRLRREVDQHYDNRMLLAEANMWPEDVRPYFGEGDECHMAFHFPLMPRLYMALAQEDRHPITDILRQTPHLPEGCQWAVFLRNHDELTLEMVTDRERDYLWNFYAADRRMRINLGIRRRLAPLMDNDRRRLELLNSLLMSMPGTPVLYYGDEIGMGDNIYLGDRDAVRTPMPWSNDRNGGFSRASPQRLFLPPVMDPVYGYSAVNVEAQQDSPSSLLNWMRRMIGVRQSHSDVFGKGELTFLYPGNRKILAYLREHEGRVILCVANMSRAPQAMELNLQRFKGRVPIELFGRAPFPPIGDLPYLLTVHRYGFFWFILTEEVEAPAWHEPIPEPLPDFITLVLRTGLGSLASGAARRQLESEILPVYLRHQPWFHRREGEIQQARLIDMIEIKADDGRDALSLSLIEVETAESREQYLMPLAIAWSEAAVATGSPLIAYMLAKVRRGPQVGALYDAYASDDLARVLAQRCQVESTVATSQGGALRLRRTQRCQEIDLPTQGTVSRLGIDREAIAQLLNDQVVVRVYRHLEAHYEEETEIGWYLTDVARYPNTAALLGAIEHVDTAGTVKPIAILQEYVPNQGNGWDVTVDYGKTLFEQIGSVNDRQERQAYLSENSFIALAHTLGQRMAELHDALAAAAADTPAFRPRPARAEDVTAWHKLSREAFGQALRRLRRLREQGQDGWLIAALEELEAHVDSVHQRLDAGGRVDMGDTLLTRIHGDFHLGHLLLVRSDFYIFDFRTEKESALGLAPRDRHTPLSDVADMLRSFDRAAWEAASRLSDRRSDEFRAFQEDARRWARALKEALLASYFQHIEHCPIWPGDAPARALLDMFTLRDAAFEAVHASADDAHALERAIAGLVDMVRRPY